VQLTRTEFLLLQLLAEHVGKPVTRQRLIQGVWGNVPVHSNTLDVFINALRSKFDVPFASRLIVTVRGIGYRLQLENDSAHRTCQEIAG
jgi:DNA-binding response OmpR family regulator